MRSSSSPPHPLDSTSLAAALGVSIDDLRKLRAQHCEPGTDWDPHSKPVVFTAAGAQKIRAALGLHASPACEKDPALTDPAPSEKNPVAGHGPIRVALTVIRPAKGSRNIVLCRTDDGSTVTMRVKDNTNFAPHMRVPSAVQRPLSCDCYDYEGRLPRTRGRF